MEPPPSSNEPKSETYHRGRKPMATAAAGVGVAAGLAWACLRFRPTRVAVEGPSMMPTLFPGDWALAVEARTYDLGDIVVVEHPVRPGYEMVKRIAAGPGAVVGERRLGPDEWWVLGDHETSSTDSRHFGPVNRDELKAKVVLVYWPKDRRRRLR
jgi:nickel-type superoxide dismutase maturation protease